ncbi:MAG: hypothetical protein QW757_03220 [Candidatus Woesearchaeota archaeon]|nr:hypothetical protein [Candidatus Aenigmarchaeota archaeon]MBU5689376.1 hypothetical protein [Candidatus Aenigmarchaeota archaeon]
MKPDVCLEVSFEAGNKVGGIYTVLVSKARHMKDIYGDNYYAIGFYNKNNLKDFDEVETPKEFKKIFTELEKEGIKCFFGKWISAYDANLILLDTKEFREKIVQGMRNVDFIKKEFWDKFKVDSLRTGFDYDEPLAWSYAVGMLIEKIFENKIFSGNIVCQFHEWLSGGAILYLVDKKIPVAKVFTTHATRIGRAKSSAGENLMEEVETGLKINKIMSDDEAYRFNLEAQHKIEKLCAHMSEVFTTVSEIVAEEAAYILGKKPDVITINGLDLSKYPSTRTMMVLHEKYREKINEFLSAYFSPYYSIENMKNNIVFFISGRYEFFNKGVDLFIEGLAKLNENLKKKKSNKTVFAFILIPSGIKGPRQDLLEALLKYEEIKDLVDDSLNSIKDEVVEEIVNGREVKIDNIIDENFKIKSKILSRLFRSKSDVAPLCAFELSYDNDMILSALQKHGLNNKKDDRVKVIFYPTYISVTDGLLSMDYEEFVLGSSMGFFPSKYEPWGYTPFETAALRTLMLTTDVAGFGVELMKECKDDKCIENRVLRVKGRSREEIIKDMARIMEWCVELDKEVRVMEKVKTRQLVERFDWSIQISNYLRAHELALERIKSIAK